MNLNILKLTVISMLVFIISIKSISAQNTFISHNNGKINKNVIENNYKEDEEQINEIESQILNFLGLSTRPKRTNTNYPSLNKSAPQYLLNIFENKINDNVPHDNDKTFRKTRSALNFITDLDEMEIEKCNNVITFMNKDIKHNKSNNIHGMKLLFNIDQLPKELSLIKCELRIFQNPFKGIYIHTGWTFTISVYQIDNKNNLKIISSINTTAAYHGWLEIDVSSVFRYWISQPKENFGIILKVEFYGQDIIPQYIGLINSQGEEQFQPFAVGFFNGPEIISKVTNFRIKREIKESKYEKPETLNHKKFHDFEKFQAPKICQRMNFSVDFKELQWNDFIIAPEKFDAFFCGGECNFPLGAAMNATNHALVQTLMHLKQPAIPKPCCAPKGLSSISVLYYLNEDTVRLIEYRHMIVESCGCH